MVILPLKDKVQELDAQIASEQRKIRKNMQIIHDAKALDAQYESLRSSFYQNGTDEQAKSSILKEIESVARDLNLQISDLKPQRVRSNEFFNTFSVSLNMDSNLPDILKFLQILQDKPHLFDVQEVRFDKSNRRDTSSINTSIILEKTLIPR